MYIISKPNVKYAAKLWDLFKIPFAFLMFSDMSIESFMATVLRINMFC